MGGTVKLWDSSVEASREQAEHGARASAGSLTVNAIVRNGEMHFVCLSHHDTVRVDGEGRRRWGLLGFLRSGSDCRSFVSLVAPTGMFQKTVMRF